MRAGHVVRRSTCFVGFCCCGSMLAWLAAARACGSLAWPPLLKPRASAANPVLDLVLCKAQVGARVKAIGCVFPCGGGFWHPSKLAHPFQS